MPNTKHLILCLNLDDSVTLCLKVDHGSYDGTLLRIFDEQFRALARGDPALPKIEPFRNFIDRAHTTDREGNLAFWKAELAGYVPGRHGVPVSDGLQLVDIGTDVDAMASQGFWLVGRRLLPGDTEEPFDHPRAGAPAGVDHMRWLVMAQSKVMMAVKYLLMVDFRR
ncbi:hypothetical protein DHEL01_v213040 [Diaporthe helianthi]|uniref:Condensation domain-containing protein n=1 Tax=Diaporthe helianthi TaxID=158607 RepID=A0A2P5HE85_DIAHE|nr:hypothetical protein DHEL01_v213040 [Diaporthe helianthi]